MSSAIMIPDQKNVTRDFSIVIAPDKLSVLLRAEWLIKRNTTSQFHIPTPSPKLLLSAHSLQTHLDCAAYRIRRQIASVVITTARNATFQVAAILRRNPPHSYTAGGCVRGLRQLVAVGGTCVDARIERTHIRQSLKVHSARVAERGAAGVVCLTPDCIR